MPSTPDILTQARQHLVDHRRVGIAGDEKFGGTCSAIAIWDAVDPDSASSAAAIRPESVAAGTALARAAGVEPPQVEDRDMAGESWTPIFAWNDALEREDKLDDILATFDRAIEANA